VMVGWWLEPEPDAAAQQRNEDEVARALELARAHPDVVGALSVGNEVLVDWSTHQVPLDRVIYFVRKVRAATSLPVTVADNYACWLGTCGVLAPEVDFIVIHSYPLWERFDIDMEDGADRAALDHTIANYDVVHERHPDVPVVIGEAGWASQVQANAQVLYGAGSEAKQKVYYEQLAAWAEQQHVLTFVFEAFDENWKGGPSPDETEKHWGLFRADRTPKLVMSELFADLVPALPNQ
jgi:exo-beta-1,3-glucanase (GH17 family)